MAATQTDRTAWGVKQLKARCRGLRDTLRVRRLATEAELAAYWPGGEENTEPGRGGWIYCYANFVGFLRRAEHRERVVDAGADETILKALRDEPIQVRRLGAEPDEAPLYVYAKSLDASLQIHALNVQLAWMLGEYNQLAALLDDPQTERRAALAETLPQVLDAVSYTYQLLAWIVTTPGPDMPYAADDDRPAPPEHIRRLEPWDMVAICRAHQQHMLRLHALTALIDERGAEDGGTRPSWSSLIGTVSMDTGEAPVTLMKHRSLASLLAAVRLNADAKAPRETPNAEN